MLKNFEQPELIELSESLRLRRYDGHFELFLPGYQDPVVYQNSEGIFDESKIPTLEYVERMCRYLSEVGELYYIEAREGDAFRPIGDVTIMDENPPIAIWFEEYRHRKIGTQVMRAVIRRLKALGYRKITGSRVYQWNLSSQRMHEKLGFLQTGESDTDFIYELDLTKL